MPRLPPTWLRLTDLFDLKEENEVKWCKEHGFIASERKCPKCGDAMTLKTSSKSIDGVEWSCEKTDHRMSCSIRKDSLFAGSKLGINTTLMLTYLWAYKYRRSSIAHETGVSEDTVASWEHFCREVCADLCFTQRDKLGGGGATVDIEEATFTSTECCNRKITRGKVVFGGIERGTYRFLFQFVGKRRKRKTALLEIVKQYILPGTVVVLDCLEAYKCSSDEDLKQFGIDNRVSFKDAGPGVRNKMTWTAVRRSMQGTKPCRNTFNSYLLEYVWRKRWAAETDFFSHFMKAATTLRNPL